MPWFSKADFLATTLHLLKALQGTSNMICCWKNIYSELLSIKLKSIGYKPSRPLLLDGLAMRPFILILMLAFVVSLRAEDSLPPAPAGYSWQRLVTIKSAVLKPDGWFFKQAKKGQTDGFFITKEDIDQSGAFQTGLTLNCIRDVPKLIGQAPSDYAASMADSAATKHELVERLTSQQVPFRAVRFRYVDAPTGKESITVYQLLIANDKTGTLFPIIFEAPTSSWSEAWKSGDIILKKLFLDDET
jgi:hypothetical protein